MACNALASGECDSAIVAGANLIQSPEQHIATMKAGVLSPTSTCHTFDMAADGYGRGESVAALYVKRLGHAIRDGDPIRSVIRGTAVNRLVPLRDISYLAFMDDHGLIFLNLIVMREPRGLLSPVY